MIIEPCGIYANAQINQQEYDIRKELHPGAQLGAIVDKAQKTLRRFWAGRR